MGGKAGGGGLEGGGLREIRNEFWKGDRRGKGRAWQAVGGKGGGGGVG